MFTWLNDMNLVNTQELPIQTLEQISVSYISMPITVVEAEGDTLVLKEYMNQNDPAYFADITAEEGRLSIRHGARPALGGLRGYVEMYLPSAYYGALCLSTVSGKIDAEGALSLQKLRVSSTSGRLSLGHITAGTAQLSTVSGKIDVQVLRAVADVHTTSGALWISAASGSGDFRTVSGRVDVTYEEVMGDIRAHTTSGRIALLLPEGLSFSVQADSVSGRIDLPVGGAYTGSARSVSGTVGGAPVARVNLSTVSGRIQVTAGEEAGDDQE